MCEFGAKGSSNLSEDLLANVGEELEDKNETVVRFD